MKIPHLPQLDGLRGVAVAAVVAYHLEPDLVPGGFLGVDVFFVLSGFLIGSLLLGEVVARGKVDLRGFYLRRVRRLMPASLVLLAAMVVYAGVFAGVGELSRLRSHILWTLGWVSNWGYIADGSSYVDLIAGASPLRHTWSLAIEEQFYAVFPLAVAALAFGCRRRGMSNIRRIVGWAAAVLVVGSALQMAVLTRGGGNIDRAYYGSDSRLQAILLGVLLAAVFLGRPPVEGRWVRVTRFAAVPAGLALVALFVVGGERSLWMYRGGFTATAVVSAALIAAVSSTGWLSAVLSWSPLVGLGKISYGVYLWHWPVVVLVDERRTGLDGLALTGFRLLLTLLVALVSFWMIEQPIRGGVLGRRFGVLAPVFALVVVGCVAVGALAVTRLPGDVGDVVRPVPTTTPGADPIRVLLAGDSVVHTLAGSEVYEFPNYREWQPADSPFDPDRATLNVATWPGCSFLPGATVPPAGSDAWEVRFGDYCPDWRREIGELVAGFRPHFVVVLLTNDSSDRRLYGDLVEVGSDAWQSLLDDALDEFRRPTEEIGAVLVLLTPPAKVGRLVAASDSGGWREAIFADGLRSYAARRPGVVVLDFADAVCPQQDCEHPTSGFDPAWRYDGWHFNGGGPAWFAEWLTPRLEPMR